MFFTSKVVYLHIKTSLSVWIRKMISLNKRGGGDMKDKSKEEASSANAQPKNKHSIGEPHRMQLIKGCSL